MTPSTCETKWTRAHIRPVDRTSVVKQKFVRKLVHTLPLKAQWDFPDQASEKRLENNQRN